VPGGARGAYWLLLKCWKRAVMRRGGFGLEAGNFFVSSRLRELA